MEDATPKESLQRWLTSLFRDPLVEILVKNSHMTKTQVETFLIDVLAEKVTGRKIIYEQKARLRLMKSGVTRGAFNRSLAQARRNVTKSIYTMILLGYLGVFDTPSLDPYVEIANKIRSYAEAYRECWKNRTTNDEHMRVMRMLHKEIEGELLRLSGASST
ncbi:MAG: hypothetical protein NWE76_10595 [Candidatus Bathyarchaeota archaeon]|nr:hypothetical protein [Candidatus Bathyarchaeota archaeon]